MVQELFHYTLRDTTTVFVGEQAVKEINKELARLNAAGWTVLSILPIVMEGDTLCHEKDTVLSEVGFLCTKN